MTTGTILRDSRYAFPNDCNSLGVAGNYFRRIWGGSDDPINHRSVNGYSCVIDSEFNPEIRWTDPTGSDPNAIKTGTYRDCLGGISWDPIVLDENDEITLINRLGDNIRQNDFDFANSVGAEGKDALEQIGRTAGSLFKAGKALNNGNIPAAAAELGIPNPFKGGKRESKKQKQNNQLGKNLSDSVLAVQLGALPLMGDISSAADALISILNRDQKRTYTAKVKAKGLCYPSIDTSKKNPCGFVVDSKRLVWTVTSSPPTVAQQLSMSNPWDLADMLWQATRLSFVADWVLPLHKYLAAMSTTWDFLGHGYVSHKYIRRGRTLYAGTGILVLPGMPYGFKHMEFTRTVLTSLTVPMPRVRPLGKIPSYQRALTAVALLGQLLL